MGGKAASRRGCPPPKQRLCTGGRCGVRTCDGFLTAASRRVFMIRFVCPKCKVALQASQAGATVACPRFKTQMLVPAPVAHIVPARRGPAREPVVPRESTSRGPLLLVGLLMVGLLVLLVAGVVVFWPRHHTSPPDPLPSAQDDAGKDSGKQTPPASLRLLEVEAARVKAGQEKMVTMRNRRQQ